jgi:hypothetical protein
MRINLAPVGAAEGCDLLLLTEQVAQDLGERPVAFFFPGMPPVTHDPLAVDQHIPYQTITTGK